MAPQPNLMTPTKLKILRYLETADPLATHGAAISKGSGVRTDRLYPDLAEMECDEWTRSEWEETYQPTVWRARRRFYRLTDLGRAEMKRVPPQPGRRSLFGWLPRVLRISAA